MVGHRRWTLVAMVAVMVITLTALLLARDEPETASTTTTTTEPSTTGTTRPPSTEAPTSTDTTSPPATVTTSPPSTATTTPPPTTWAGGPATIVRKGTSGRAEVALTFDAGSDVGYASAILDTLAANGIRASFGLTGRWTADHPEVVARMAREGHQLLNHTWSHPSFTGRSTGSGPLSRAERINQIQRAEDAIVAAGGVPARPWFRPPYGDLDDGVLADVGAAGYRYVAMWTVDSLGWKGLSASQIVDRCLAGAEPGAVYLFHVGSASADHAALQAIIDGLRARGYRFTTLTGLIAP